MRTWRWSSSPLCSHGSHTRKLSFPLREGLRSHPNQRTPSVLQWARLWLGVTKVSVLQQSFKALIDSSSGGGDDTATISSMDSHETADLMLRSVDPEVYCIQLPKLLLSDAFTPAQVVSLLITTLIRCVREDIDLTPVCHTMLQVLPSLAETHRAEMGLSLYIPVLAETCPPMLFESLALFILQCLLNLKPQAHRLSHALHGDQVASELEKLCAELESSELPPVQELASTIQTEVQRKLQSQKL